MLLVAAITLKVGVVEQSIFVVPRITDMAQIAVLIVCGAEQPTSIGGVGLRPLARTLANAIARLTGEPPREVPFKLA